MQKNQQSVFRFNMIKVGYSSDSDGNSVVSYQRDGELLRKETRYPTYRVAKVYKAECQQCGCSLFHKDNQEYTEIRLDYEETFTLYCACGGKLLVI